MALLAVTIPAVAVMLLLPALLPEGIFAAALTGMGPALAALAWATAWQLGRRESAT